MATNLWKGDADGNCANAANWSEGIPVANQDVIIPPWATNGLTSNLDAITSIALNSFWVQEGFTKNIGTTTGFFRLDITGSSPTRFLYEGSSTLAKFHFRKTGQYVSLEVRKTGVGTTGQPAFQMMTDNVSASASTYVGKLSVYSGEVSLGPEHQICELLALTVGERAAESDAVVHIGTNCRDIDPSNSPLLTVDVNGGMVYADNSLITVSQYGGVIEHRGDAIYVLNLWGGTSRLNNPTGTSGGKVITKLNLRGGTLDNSENPTQKTITNADLHSGSIDDPLAKLTWTNAVVYKGAKNDVEFDWGPERTITIA